MVATDLDPRFTFDSFVVGPGNRLRSVGARTAAVACPQVSAFGTDAYPDIWTKAAALLRSVVEGHPLTDGNKRLDGSPSSCAWRQRTSLSGRPPTC